MSIEENIEKSAFERYLSPIHAWALSLGCAVGWGAFVMPGTTFLPSAGPLGTTIGLVVGAIIMFIIGVNYHFLINKYPSSGGTLTYTIRTLGHDHGFMSAWFLILVYIAIIWANASAIGLISKNLFGNTFQFGFYYQFLGYDVYFGEVLLSVIAILICGFLCISNKRMAVNIQVILALVLILGISFCAFNALTAEPGRNVITKPYFAGGDTFSPKQVITIVALSPWAFVGFESISNSAQGFKFSTKKSLGIMTAALLCAVLGYVLLTLMATSNIDGRYTGWNEYIADLSNLKGVEGLPTFHAANVSMGRLGVVILGLAALSGIMTGLIGNMIAASRLIYAMA
ncbi:MAG: APC family permease, partial [Butyrivibrio sp.]|nr:APC family permease [Butyrivibrio sp.]